MLSLPDFKQKQILFIQTDWESRPHLQLTNQNLVFKKNDQIINRASCSKILSVFVIGDFSITTKLIKESMDYGISFFFLKWNFETYAEINSKAAGNYLLRTKQYLLTPEKELEIAQKLIQIKTENQLRLLKQTRHLTDIKKPAKDYFEQIQNCRDYKELLGIEGNLAGEFYRQYFTDIGWLRRMPRVKPDIPNLLMDIGYTYLFNLIDSLLQLHGFDTYKGVYHKLFFQRKSLACDLMEPFRCLIDKQILKAYHLGQINEKDFTVKNGQVSLPWKHSKKYSSLFFDTLMDHKEDIFKFIKGYYHFMLYDDRDFPKYKIKIK